MHALQELCSRIIVEPLTLRLSCASSAVDQSLSVLDASAMSLERMTKRWSTRRTPVRAISGIVDEYRCVAGEYIIRVVGVDGEVVDGVGLGPGGEGEDG